MKETLKTLTLVLLIALSLLQSYLLAYSSPKPDPVSSPTQYVETEKLGTQETAEQLLFPSEIILHMGNDKHTVIYPRSTFFDMILQVLQERAFDGLRPAFETGVPWDQLRSEDRSVEIRLGNGLPFGLLDRLLQIKGDQAMSSVMVSRIWIVRSEDEVTVYFFTKDDGQVFEAANANMTVKDIDTFIGFGEYQTNYHLLDGSVYIPDDAIDVSTVSIPYETIRPEQMENVLFVDPDVTRNIVERDGTEIYTDGKRGLQVKKEQQWMTYSDPVAPVKEQSDPVEDVVSAVQFVNQRGGWNGVYGLDTVVADSPNGNRVGFRMYVGSRPDGYMPVVPDAAFHYGDMQLTFLNGQVTEYQRSLLTLKTAQASIKTTSIPGGDILDEWVEKSGYRGQIRSVIPAYRPRLAKDAIQFVPVWAAVLEDGTVHVMNG